MSRPFRLHLFAEDDLVEIWEWYEAQERGPGDHFALIPGRSKRHAIGLRHPLLRPIGLIDRGSKLNIASDGA